MATASLLVTLVKATLELVAAMALARALQRAAAGARYLVWLVTLGGLLLVPTLAAWAPLRLAVLPARAAVSAPIPSTPFGPAAEDGSQAWPKSAAAATAGSLGAMASPDGRAADAGPRPATGADAMAVSAARHPVLLLGALWGVVALAVAGSLLRAWLAVRHIVRHARPLDGADWCDPLWEVADRLGLDEPPRLLRSEAAKMPFACGLARPTIVLPAASDAWTPDRRRAVLLHELAHVRRRDLAGHTLARVVCAVYWFHPLVWTAARRLRAESERACDDLALTCGARAADYAEHLLDIVTSVRGDATPSAALAMARRTEFEGRMLDILDGERRRSAPSRRQAASLVGALALVTITVGAVVPVPVAGAREAAAASTVAAASSQPEVPVPNVPAVVPPSVRAPGGAPRRVGVAPSAAPAEAGAEADAAAAADVEVSVASAPVARVAPTAPTPQPAPAQHTAPLPGLVQAAATAQPGAPRGDERADLLMRVLRTDTSASLRRVAAWGLAQHAGESGVTAALAAALRGDRAAAVRETAAWSLAEAERDPAARDALAAALRADADPTVRATAAWALGSTGDRSAAEPLAAALGDASAAVRARAAWALGAVGPREAPRALIGMLGDGDPHVRKLAAWALYTIEDPAAVPALQSAFKAERDPELQVAYVRALAALGERSVDALRGLLESSDPRIRDVAVRALAGGHATGPWPWPWPQPRPFP